ncbi:MAG: hypothetical protein Q7T71_16740, partial [Herbiconiux sp.]|nr:hypothetical protein [Herbiconiux sp.]
MSRFHRSELRLASLSVAALAATVGLLCGAGAAPAGATPELVAGVADPVAMLTRIAPDLLAETRAPLDDRQAA